jgi:exoribonuclease II
VRLGAMDLLMLDVSGTLVERLDTSAETVAEEAEDEEEVSTGVRLALDVNEPDPEAPSPQAHSAPA